MADPRTFISFDYDHNEGSRKYFVGQSSNSRTPFNIQDWSSKIELDEKIWEQEIEEKIKKCHLMIVLVGRNMSTAKGVHLEIQMALRNNVPVFGIYVDEANTASNLPPGLSRNNVITWNWPGITNMIDLSMKMGKNKI